MTKQEKGELILYRTEYGRDTIQLRAASGTVWLTPSEIAAPQIRRPEGRQNLTTVSPSLLKASCITLSSRNRPLNIGVVHRATA